jgi:hypothetical protein
VKFLFSGHWLFAWISSLRQSRSQELAEILASQIVFNIEQTPMSQNLEHLVVNMRYDVFRSSGHGIPVHIIAVATLGEAEQALDALEWGEPGDYFVCETVSGRIVYGRATPSEPRETKTTN